MGKRDGAYVGLRAPSRLKAQLAAAAHKNGRSLSSEAQFRLEQSFQRTAIIREVLAIVEERNG